MSNPIDRDEAIEAVKTALLSWSSMPQWRDDKIIDVLAELPSAQPEIIRCKDCRWGQAHAHDGLRICEYHDDFPKMDDDFCSRGEKV